MRYQTEGEPLPVLICDMEKGETIVTQSGAMSWMSANMRMEQKSGGIGKMLGRMLTNESLFLTHYTAAGGIGQIAFASRFPGSIKAFPLSPGRSIVAQKSAFLAFCGDVDMSVFFQKKIGSGLFGGEGFIMQRFSGDGIVFLEFDGYVKEYDIPAGGQIIVDTGYLAAMSETCSVNIQTVPGIKNVLFGGEGLFNTVINGPGKVYLQSIPVAKLAGVIRPYIPVNNQNH